MYAVTMMQIYSNVDDGTHRNSGRVQFTSRVASGELSVIYVVFAYFPDTGHFCICL